MTEVFRDPLEGLASPERRALSASPGLDFQGLQAPKVNFQGKLIALAMAHMCPGGGIHPLADHH